MSRWTGRGLHRGGERISERQARVAGPRPGRLVSRDRLSNPRGQPPRPTLLEAARSVRRPRPPGPRRAGHGGPAPFAIGKFREPRRRPRRRLYWAPRPWPAARGRARDSVLGVAAAASVTAGPPARGPPPRRRRRPGPRSRSPRDRRGRRGGRIGPAAIIISDPLARRRRRLRPYWQRAAP